MRILQVITDTDRRGAQVFATDLGLAFASAGHEVSTVALAPGSHGQQLDLPVLGTARRAPSTIRALRRRMSSADVTIAHGSATGLACALTLRPFVYRQIGDTRFWAAGWARRLRVALYLRRARHIVALSPGAATALHEHLWLPSAKITVAPNGVPYRNFEPPDSSEKAALRSDLHLPDDELVAVYVGGLAQGKGVDLAIRATSNCEGVRLLVAGGGTDEHALRSLAIELGAPVAFLGVLDRARIAYAAADVNVLPSRGGDSMPATLIEAGLCGVPSVSTEVGSITDVVLDGTNGIIVPIDDVDALRAALVHLRDHPELRQQMGEAARQHCLAHFEIGVVAAKWLEVLERARRR